MTDNAIPHDPTVELVAKAIYLSYGGYDDWDTRADEGSMYEGLFKNDCRLMAVAAIQALVEQHRARS